MVAVRMMMMVMIVHTKVFERVVIIAITGRKGIHLRCCVGIGWHGTTVPKTATIGGSPIFWAVGRRGRIASRTVAAAAHTHGVTWSILGFCSAIVDDPVGAFAWFIDRTRDADKTLVQRKIVADWVLWDRFMPLVTVVQRETLFSLPSSRCQLCHNMDNDQWPIDISHWGSVSSVDCSQ